MIKNVLFDLDSTLLEMDQNEFIKEYLKSLGIKAYKEHNIDPNLFAKEVMKSTYQMINNNGDKTNEEVFFLDFNKKFNDFDTYKFFMDYYENEYNDLESFVKRTEYPNLIVNLLHEKGYNLYIATTPLFPKIAIYKRILWAGLNKDLFKYISTYEISHYAKPNEKYFKEILEKNNLVPEETILIGNDMQDDFSQTPEGVSKYLIEDYMLNVTDKSKIEFRHSTLKELYEFLKDNNL